MVTKRMTRAMKVSLEVRLAELDERIATLDDQRSRDDSGESALLAQLTRERDQVADALRDATLIDDEPFDFGAIEVGDLVTLQGDNGKVEKYLLVDGGVGTRARDDWVSVDSPLGSALLGRAKGERLEVSSPQGVATYVVVEFERARGDAESPEGFRG